MEKKNEDARVTGYFPPTQLVRVPALQSGMAAHSISRVPEAADVINGSAAGVTYCGHLSASNFREA